MGFIVCYRANILHNYTVLITNIIIVTFIVVTLVTKSTSVPIDTMAKMITNFTTVYMVLIN